MMGERRDIEDPILLTTTTSTNHDEFKAAFTYFFAPHKCFHCSPSRFVMRRFRWCSAVVYYVAFLAQVLEVRSEELWKSTFPPRWGRIVWIFLFWPFTVHKAKFSRRIPRGIESIDHRIKIVSRVIMIRMYFASVVGRYYPRTNSSTHTVAKQCRIDKSM